jgi:hypothetical protein
LSSASETRASLLRCATFKPICEVRDEFVVMGAVFVGVLILGSKMLQLSQEIRLVSRPVGEAGPASNGR